jgi:hypothetical protein
VPGTAALTLTGGAGGGGPSNPQALNRFTYVFNNPIKLTDPTGHCPWCIVGAIGGAIVGAGIAYGAQVYANTQQGMDIGAAMTTNINGAAIATGAIAGAVVGGTMGLASTGAVTGLTVGTVAQMGALGSATSMAGTAVGQLASTGTVNPTDVAVAGVVGFASGAAAPIAGATMLTAAGLGAVSNVAQYTATQSIKGEQMTGAGVMTNAASGVIGGALGGAVSTVPKALSFDTAERAFSRMLNAKAFTSLNLGTGSFLRAGLGAGVSGWDYQKTVNGRQPQ